MARENISRRNLQALNQDAALAPDLSILDTLLRPIDDEGVRQAPKEKASNIPGNEALVSAIAAGVLFGPFVGAAVGGAVHMRQKKKDQNQLDRLIKEQEKIEGGQNLFNSSLELRREAMTELFATTKNEHDVQQVNEMKTQLDAIELLGANSDTAQQAAAAQLLREHDQGRENYLRNQELDAVALETRDKAEVRQLGLDKQADLKDKRARYDPKADAFENITAARNKAIKALSAENFSYADAHTGVVAYFKTGDPESAVLGPEFEVGSNFGDLITKGLSFANSIFTGQAMTTKQRREMIRAIERSYEEAVEIQRRHESKFMQELSDDDFPESKVNYFQTINRMPVPEFRVIEPDALERGDAIMSTLNAIGNSLPGSEIAKLAGEAVIDEAGNLIEGVRRFQQDVKRSGLRPHN